MTSGFGQIAEAEVYTAVVSFQDFPARAESSVSGCQLHFSDAQFKLPVPKFFGLFICF